MALFSTIGSIINAKSQNKQAAKAGEIATQNNTANNALAQGIFNTNQANLTPYMNAGTQPLSLMQGALGYGDQGAYRGAFQNFINNSDYGFQQQQGMDTLSSQASGGGWLQSGAALQEGERFKQNLQSGYRQEYNNMLGNQQALGLSGASALAGVSQNYTNTVSANNNLGAQGAANALLARQNPLANGLASYGGALQGMLPGLGGMF